MTARPLIVGLFCILAGVFLILLFFKKFYEPLVASLKTAHSLTNQGTQNGAGDKFKFSSDIERRMQMYAADRAHKTQIALAWEGLVDLDLHCIEPGGEEINYSHALSRSGAKLDVDMNASGRKSATPLEHIFFNDQSMLTGQYQVSVVLYDWRSQPEYPVHFHLEILKEGRPPLAYDDALSSKGDSRSYTFTFP